MYDQVVLQNGKIVEKRIDAKDRISAYNTLAKFHGLLQPEVQVNQQFNINVDIVDAVEDDAEVIEPDEEEIVEGDFTELESDEDEEVVFNSADFDAGFLGGIGKQ